MSSPTGENQPTRVNEHHPEEHAGSDHHASSTAPENEPSLTASITPAATAVPVLGDDRSALKNYPRSPE
jgi:hypothetical protein